ncbi:cell surface protein [Bifidobacterium parmae]|uniref:Cell surface protein n=1 Tax=Bifidobacterium parmae TaxID=361854 RepID=A0A2N5J3C2_9BIFI|nr:cell surface protein [Bifidobacterium parmae]
MGLSQDSGDADLSGNEITDYSVINVRNVTELPKTGAAGIVLFAVVGLLFAGAAGTVFAKSRATERALRA